MKTGTVIAFAEYQTENKRYENPNEKARAYRCRKKGLTYVRQDFSPPTPILTPQMEVTMWEEAEREFEKHQRQLVKAEKQWTRLLAGRVFT